MNVLIVDSHILMRINMQLNRLRIPDQLSICLHNSVIEHVDSQSKLLLAQICLST